MIIIKHVLFYLLLGLLVTHINNAIAHDDHLHTFDTDYLPSAKWTNLANGKHSVGKSHGEIDVAKDGKFYLSLMSTPEVSGGIRIYSPEGEHIGNVPNAPDDFHGFVVHQDNNGKEYIYGTSLKNQKIIKMTLTGDIVLTINAATLIPNQYQNLNKDKNNQPLPPLKLTAIAVDRADNIYVVDGYGLDYIHKFNPQGLYINTFGGKKSPYEFNNCHKIHIDPRFEPNRLICTDRKNGRLVHMQLNGDLIGTYANNLRRPSSVAFYGDIAAVAEISGRVSLLDKKGNALNTIGTNEVAEEINTNLTAPSKWRDGIFTAPHGIAFDRQGNLYITEWNKWGRIMRFDMSRNIATGQMQ